MKKFLSAIVVCLAPSASMADVISAGPGGFEVRHSVVVNAARADVWRAALDVGDWWNGDHTISGDASRMSINAAPLGCFCEDLGNGNGVVHLTVTSVSTNVMLRLTGGLGPLGVMGVSGAMTWEFEDEGDGTRVTFNYAVGGYRAGGLETLALPVDGVIGEALDRLAAYAERGNPDDEAQ